MRSLRADRLEVSEGKCKAACKAACDAQVGAPASYSSRIRTLRPHSVEVSEAFEGGCGRGGP
jgi:hypothetical protein